MYDNDVKDLIRLGRVVIENSRGYCIPTFKRIKIGLEKAKKENFYKTAEIDNEIDSLINDLNLKITKAEELQKASEFDTTYKKSIVDKLSELGVTMVFYTDTTPEFETYLTDKGISGVVVFQRENVDGICNSVKATAISSLEQINENHLGNGHVKYVKGKKGTIYIDGQMETLILKGNTKQILDEMHRALEDAVSLLRHDLKSVIGAGAIEMEIAKHLKNVSRRMGGKEAIAVEKFVESIESIVTTLAENCGLDSIEILSLLRNLHETNEVMGVDAVLGVSDAKERKIFEPALIKIHAINSSLNIANLILKLDGIYQGDMK